MKRSDGPGRFSVSRHQARVPGGRRVCHRCRVTVDSLNCPRCGQLTVTGLSYRAKPRYRPLSTVAPNDREVPTTHRLLLTKALRARDLRSEDGSS